MFTKKVEVVSVVSESKLSGEKTKKLKRKRKKMKWWHKKPHSSSTSSYYKAGSTHTALTPLPSF